MEIKRILYPYTIFGDLPLENLMREIQELTP